MQAPADPQSLNRYAYARNNPQSLIDPSGYSWFSSLFKAIGKFFKNIVKNPGVFIATVIVGVATGGLALAAAPAIGLAAGSIGAYAFAGAVGGFFAGGVGSVMGGGSFWKGAVIGLAGGALGGGIGAAVGGFGGVVAGSFAGGFTSGLVASGFYGGKAFRNALAAGIGSAVIATGVYGAAKGIGYLASNNGNQSQAALTTQESLNPASSRNPVAEDPNFRPDFYGKRVEYLEATPQHPAAAEAFGQNVSIFNSELTGGDMGARTFFAEKTGVFPEGDFANRFGQYGQRFVYRGSSTGLPTVEVTDYVSGVVEKIRFKP